MLGMMRWRAMVKVLFMVVLIGILGVTGWGDRGTGQLAIAAPRNPAKLAGKITETAPPQLIQDLQAEFEDNQPQVKILGPKPNEVLQDNTVSVQFQVKDLPIFKNEKFGLGPHLDVLLDNQPAPAVYDLKQPLVLPNLSPGTHTLRAFAARPWHESFKNEGAYAQVTFHVFTKTDENHPDPEQPLLTYGQPEGTYGAEPIPLDFYLTNAPLHLVAQEDTKDDIPDWRIRVTVNGDDFVLDQWEPLYLKGFKPGKNWVKLEYIDENGNPRNNVFSNTARLITVEPNGRDGLSRIVRGEVSLAEARAIADPTYTYTPPTPPAPKPAPSPEPKPAPSPEPKPAPVIVAPVIVPAPVMAPMPVPSPSPSPVASPPAIAPRPKAAKPKPPSLLRPKAPPKPVVPEVKPEPDPAPASPEKIAVPLEKSRPKAMPKPEPVTPKLVKPEPVKPALGSVEPEKDTAPAETPAPRPSKLDGLMQRFRQKAADLQEKAAQLQEKAATVKVPTLQDLQQRNRQPDRPPTATPGTTAAPGIPQSL